MATGIVVNTENVKELPTSWKVLTSEDSKGKIIMPSPLYSGAAAYNLGVLTRQDTLVGISMKIFKPMKYKLQKEMEMC